jgi:hypothetical protein
MSTLIHDDFSSIVVAWWWEAPFAGSSRLDSTRLSRSHLRGLCEDPFVLARLRSMMMEFRSGQGREMTAQRCFDEWFALVESGRIRLYSRERPTLVGSREDPIPAEIEAYDAPPPARRPAPAPAPDPSPFFSAVDVAAQVATLVAAAQNGVPFCEECAKAKAAASAA